MSAYSTLILATSGLSAYYRLGEVSGSSSATDAAGGTALSVVGTVTFGAAGLIAGDADTAATLGGAGRLRRSGAVVSAYPLSLECVCRPATLHSGTMLTICNSADDGKWLARITVSSGGAIGCDTNRSAGFSNISAGTYAAGARLHVVATYTATAMTLYLNGQQVGTNTRPSDTPASDRTTIGVLDRPSAAEFFNGVIDEASICNVALSSAQVLARYTAASATGGLLLARRRAAAA